jgi:large subunit ribosomal protein L18
MRAKPSAARLARHSVSKQREFTTEITETTDERTTRSSDRWRGREKRTQFLFLSPSDPEFFVLSVVNPVWGLKTVKGTNYRQHVSEQRLRRQRHVRKKLSGTSERPRLAVFRSSKHIYAQVIDDQTGRTIVSAGSVESAFKQETAYGGNKSAAAQVGKLVAERAKGAGIDKVCFDRRSYKYHGRVQALADAAREAGLQF